MEQQIIDILTWAVLALLGVATYFLRGIHADMKEVRKELHRQSGTQIKLETTLLDHARRLDRLENQN